MTMTLTSSIQPLLSPPESHRIVEPRPFLAGFTAEWEFHPTLKSKID